MARARNIKPSFFINEDLVELPFETRLLFVGLWTLCDRQGYLEDKPKKIKMAIFPADDVNVDAMLNELQDSNFLIRYVAENRKCIFLPKFTKHQNPHHKETINDVPRYNPCPSQDQGETKASPSQEQGVTPSDVVFSENQDSLNELNSITYGNDHQYLGQALDEPESDRADILIPDSLNLNPDYGNLNTDINDPRFNLSLSEVNTKLQMGGLRPITQEDLQPLIVKLHSSYSHKNQMVKNQILGKAFEWIERQQKTPIAPPKTPYQTSQQRTATEMDRWKQAEKQVLGGEKDITPKKPLLIEEVGHA